MHYLKDFNYEHEMLQAEREAGYDIAMNEAWKNHNEIVQQCVNSLAELRTKHLWADESFLNGINESIYHLEDQILSESKFRELKAA